MIESSDLIVDFFFGVPIAELTLDVLMALGGPFSPVTQNMSSPWSAQLLTKK
jgi:hypothetical protein